MTCCGSDRNGPLPVTMFGGRPTGSVVGQGATECQLDADEIAQRLATAGTRVVSLTPERGDLEQVFLELTSSPKLEVRS